MANFLVAVHAGAGFHAPGKAEGYRLGETDLVPDDRVKKGRVTLLQFLNLPI